MSLRFLLVFPVLVVAASVCYGTTWGEVDVICPVCNTTNTFESPMSYGSYIYDSPSKFQYLFWPDTTNVSLYYCKHCHLTAFMGDFDKIEKDKIPQIRSALTSLRLKKQTVAYFDIPMSQRLNI